MACAFREKEHRGCEGEGRDEAVELSCTAMHFSSRGSLETTEIEEKRGRCRRAIEERVEREVFEIQAVQRSSIGRTS